VYQHLFVPVDGSELSERAMEGSIGLAKQLGARITGFVVEPDISLAVASGPPSGFPGRLKAHEERNEKHAAKLLGSFKERADAAGVAFTGIHVASSSVDQSIADEAQRAGCDMIVMVTHGRGTMGELLFGSHTKAVIAKTQLPLFVLH
jgi:nucleotide-binding universal stress UspA family protein